MSIETTIKTKVVRALRWSAGARFSAQIGTWAVTIYVIRILSPEDYGLMSMAAVFMGFAQMANELGVIPALIQTKEKDEYLVRQVFGVVIISNAVLFIVMYLSAPLIAAFFGEENLTSIVRVLSLTLPIGSLSAVPLALLQRDIRFKGISIVEFTAMILGSLVTLALASLGYGVWSLVVGNLTVLTTKTVGILIISRFHILPVFRFRGLRHIFSFGAKITGQRILWYINSQIDVIIVGKLLGNQALGIYSVAFHLATLPMSKVMNIVNQVTFPAYSRLQNDKTLASEYFLKSVQLSFLIFVPILWGLSSVSADFVDVFIGKKWAGAEIVIQLIALVIPFRTLSMLLAPLTDGLGRPGLGLRNLFTFSATIPVAIFIGTYWGLVGVCVGLLIASALALVINFRRSLPVIGISAADLIAAIAPSAISGIVMYAAVVAVRMYVVPDESAALRLAILIATGATVYIAMTLLLNRDTARQSVALMIGAKA